SSALSVQLPPDFTRAVDLEVLLPDPADLLSKDLLSLGPSGSKRRVTLLCFVRVVGGWSDRQHARDRLDSILLPVLVDEGHHHLCLRSSSAWAKKAAAFRRISLARRSSRFSRSSSFIRSRSVVVSPGRLPASRSACRTQFRSVSPEQPIFSAIDWMAAHCDAYSASCSNTIRTARSRTSGEYFFACFMTPISLRLESPANPGRFNHRIHVLVAQHFLGPRPPGFEVNHKNGIKEDNRAANLAWVSHRENMRHALRTCLNWARGERHPHAKLTEAQVLELRAAYARGGVTQKELAHRVGVSPGYMNLILRGKRWRHLAA